MDLWVEILDGVSNLLEMILLINSWKGSKKDSKKDKGNKE